MSVSLRICLSPGSVAGGGIGVVMLNLAEAFLAQGHQVDLLHIGPTGGRVPPSGCRLVSLGARARHALPQARAYLRAARPDLVISARDYVNLVMWGARALARLGSARPALIWSFHTHHASELAQGAGVRDRLAAAILRRLIDRPEALVAVSQAVAQGLVQDFGLPEGRVHVIENPVWTPARLEARAAPCPHPWLAARPLWGVGRVTSNPSPVILGVGRLVVQKDFATLLDAFARGPRDWRLILLGEGPLESALRAQIRAAGLEGRVDLAGHVADALPYMARADLFVLPSRWEGFPMALVEALGAGCPVVASNCPGASAEIVAHGRLGRLVPPGDPVALMQAMAATLAAPGEAHPRVVAAHRFDAARAALRYLACLEHPA